MDRDIDISFRRKQFLRRLALAASLAAALAAAFIWGPRLIAPSLARARVRTARVDTGRVEASITASGNVLPEFEQVLSSPVNARVLKILKRPGAVLVRGEAVIQLDLNESLLSIEKLNRQIELKRNQQAKEKLDLEDKMIDLQGRWEIKNLEHKAAKASTARNRTLFQQSLLSEESLRELELIEAKIALELRQLEEAKRIAEQATKTQLEGLALELKTLEGDRNEARRQLDLATTKAERAGVMTWVINEEGATVQKGELLARIADLSSFRVEATISDVHANRLSAGQHVKVRLNEAAALGGSIARVNPTVTNGLVTLVVNLDDKSNPQLRSNLRVDVEIETDRKERALRIKKGPFANGNSSNDVFVIRGNVASKTPARFGISGGDSFEIIQGLLAGDEVIISDMTEFMHVKEVRLR
jgi:HlyD family secretion protein